jgi:hypothetical protein
MHPAHIEYLFNTLPKGGLYDLFNLLDRLDAQTRSTFLGFIPYLITGNSEADYDKFKKRCFELGHVIEEHFLTYSLVIFSLQGLFAISDVGNVDKTIADRVETTETFELWLDYKRGIKTPLDHVFEQMPNNSEEQIQSLIETGQKLVNSLPARIQGNYEAYKDVCEKVIAELNKVK